MKEEKRKRKAKSKILVTLVAVTAFVSVLAWYQMQNAKAFWSHDEPKAAHYKDGCAFIYISGPDGNNQVEVDFTSDDYNKTKSEAYNTYIKRSHNYTITAAGGSGPYKLRVESQNITSKKDGAGNYSLLEFKVKIDIPAHQQHRTGWEGAHASNDTPTDGISGNEIQCYTGGTGGFWQKSGHSDKAQENVEILCHMSTANVGLATNTIYTKETDKYSYKRYKEASITMYLEKRQGTLTFHGNGGNLRFNSSDAWSSDVSKTLRDRDQYGTFPVGQRNRYTLKGFNTKQDGTGETVATNWQFCDNYDVYAVWEENKYTVSFDANGASGAKKQTQLRSGIDDALPANTFQRAGYIFIGWSKEKDAVKPMYTDGQAVRDLCGTGQTCQLYAVWKKSDGSFDLHNLIRDDSMFQGDIEIEGGNKTGFSRDHIDSQYARIDKDGKPGYFTNRY